MTDIDQACRVCGCTDNNCQRCVERTGMPCFWVEPDLCSACLTGYQPARVVALCLGVSRQSIYGWKRARPDELRTKEKDGHILFNVVDCRRIKKNPRTPGRKAS